MVLPAASASNTITSSNAIHSEPACPTFASNSRSGAEGPSYIGGRRTDT